MGNLRSDEELITACACGDRSAMDVLVSRYHSRLLDFAFRHLSNREAAADAAQTALIKAFTCAGSYRRKAPFRVWIYRITLNLIRDEIRKRQYANRYQADAPETEPIESRTPEDEVLSRMNGNTLWEYIETLADGPRTAIILKFREQFTYEEIAEVTGSPVGTIKSWVHHGLETLRKRIGPEMCEEQI